MENFSVMLFFVRLYKTLVFVVQFYGTKIK